MSKPAPDPQLPLLPLGAAVSFHVCDPEAKGLVAAAASGGAEGGALDAASADTAALRAAPLAAWAAAPRASRSRASSARAIRSNWPKTKGA